MRHLFWIIVMATRFWFILQKCNFSRLICDKCECSRRTLSNNYVKFNGVSNTFNTSIFHDFSSVNNQTYDITERCHKPTGIQILLLSFFGLFNTIKEESKWEGERELIHKISLAELALQDGDLDKATEVLEGALVLADEKDVVVGVACVYDMLATIAYQQGKVDHAEELLIRSIERLVQIGIPENDNQIVNFGLKLSRIYSSSGEDELAEMGFRNCIAVQKPKMYSGEGMNDDETGMLWISILFWYGKFLLNKGRYEEAQAHLEQAYATSALVRSIMSSQVMVILYHLSESAFARKEYDDSLRYLMNALILGRDSNNPDLPTYHVRIGIVYMHKEMFEQAKLWCEYGRRSARVYKNKEAENEAIECLNRLSQIKSA